MKYYPDLKYVCRNSPAKVRQCANVCDKGKSFPGTDTECTGTNAPCKKEGGVCSVCDCGTKKYIYPPSTEPSAVASPSPSAVPSGPTQLYSEIGPGVCLDGKGQTYDLVFVRNPPCTDYV